MTDGQPEEIAVVIYDQRGKRGSLTPVLVHADGSNCSHPGRPPAHFGPDICHAGHPVTHARWEGTLLTIDQVHQSLRSIAEAWTKLIGPSMSRLIAVTEPLLSSDFLIRALAVATAVVEEERHRLAREEPADPATPFPAELDTSRPARRRAAEAVSDIGIRYGLDIHDHVAEKIADAILGCADTDLFVEQLVNDDMYENLEAMDRLRNHMRQRLAIDAIDKGLLMTRMPHEVVDRPPDLFGKYLHRIRLIVPVRRADADR